jgi:hypothetical protein
MRSRSRKAVRNIGVPDSSAAVLSGESGLDFTFLCTNGGATPTFATSTVEPPALVECQWTGGAPLARPCALCREGCSGSRGWVAPPRNSTTRGTARSFLGENRKRGPKTAAPLVIREHAQLKRASERTREGSAGAVDGRPHNGADAYLPASTRCNMTGSACLTAPTATD